MAVAWHGSPESSSRIVRITGHMNKHTMAAARDACVRRASISRPRKVTSVHCAIMYFEDSLVLPNQNKLMGGAIQVLNPTIPSPYG